MRTRRADSRTPRPPRSVDAAAVADDGAEPVDWYELPRIYDALFAEGTEREADFLEAVVSRHAASPGHALEVLEPACGSGRLVVELARRGHRVTGFDASAAMLGHAESRLAARGLNARLFEDDLARFDPERIAAERPFDLAFCLVSTFKYLATEGAARSHLARVARSLAPGGLYVLGLHLSEYADRTPSRESWHARRDGLDVRSVLDAAPPDRLLRRERCTVRLEVRREVLPEARLDERDRGRGGNRDGAGGAPPRRYRHEFGFRTYDVGQLRALLAKVPELELVATYGFDYDVGAPVPLDGDRLDVVLVLRRSGADR